MALPLLLGAIGAGTGLLSSLLGSSSKNSQIDDLLEELKKSRYSEEQIARRQNEVKRTYGNTVDSMIGSAGFLNGDTARMIANSKIATQSAQAQIKERFALEDQNRQLDLKSAELSGQKVGTAGILSSALLDTLNTGIQGYTTGSYLDMLNPTKDVTETLTNDILNNTVANANQPVDMSNINRDLGNFTNPSKNVLQEADSSFLPPMLKGNNLPSTSPLGAMTDYSTDNPYWGIGKIDTKGMNKNSLGMNLLNISDSLFSDQLSIPSNNNTSLIPKLEQMSLRPVRDKNKKATSFLNPKFQKFLRF